ncbi:MAG TPA: radical SAM protein [Acidobacteriota bacterium]|nr:radical SAM protein [Acidobacteriota bacterium]
MDCAVQVLKGNDEFLKRFRDRIRAERTPLYGSLELIRTCNLRCAHCYLGSPAARRIPLLPTARWLDLLDEITEAGCLFLLITGGEPLLHPDFEAIYRKAKVNGMYVTVFCNGTMVTPEVVSLFVDLPPQLVEITVYGASPATYEAVTGDANSFEQCLAGIDLLRKAGINVKLKTVLMSLNEADFEELERLAEGLGLGFRFDSMITAQSDGDLSPLDLRLPPSRAVKKEFSTEARRNGWKSLVSDINFLPPGGQNLYDCGAGLFTFHVDADGTLRPCMMSQDYCYDLKGGDFRTGWENAYRDLGDRKMPPGYPCNSCEIRAVCNFCPPAMTVEDGDRPPVYYCEMAQQRIKALKEISARSET